MRNPEPLYAASYALQIISEAVRNIPDRLLGDVEGIPWAQIRGFGNVSRHEYFGVDPNIVWTTINDEMDPLEKAMLLVRARLDDETGTS